MDQRNGKQGQQSVVSFRFFLEKKEIIGQDLKQPNVTSSLAIADWKTSRGHIQLKLFFTYYNANTMKEYRQK